MTEGGGREWQRGDYKISTDYERLEIHTIHDFLSNDSYWAQGRSVETIQRSLENSFNFGLYKNDNQIGFARVVTDFATFAWVADVFVLPEHRGQGLSKWLWGIRSCKDFAVGYWQPKTRTLYTNALASSRCIGLSAGWSARIPRCRKALIIGRNRN